MRTHALWACQKYGPRFGSSRFGMDPPKLLWFAGSHPADRIAREMLKRGEPCLCRFGALVAAERMFKRFAHNPYPW